MPPSGLPARVRWSVDGQEFNGPPDELGREWVISKDTGWSASPPVRDGQSAPRHGTHGSWPATVYREPRTIRLDGWVYAPTFEARRDAEHRLAALCAEPSGRYGLRCTEETGELFATVTQDDATLVSIRPGGLWLDFSVQVVAADPRKYSASERSTDGRLPHDSTTGLDFTAGTSAGLDFSDGLDFGPQPHPGWITATNDGTADTAPVLTLTGPLSGPVVITRRDNGATFVYLDSLPSTQRLVIDTGQRVVLLGTTTSRHRAVVHDWDALAIPARTTAGYVLTHNGNPNDAAHLKIAWRSAWW